MRHAYIAIEGNIGSGKTTMARLLANHYQAKLVLERFEENPFLAGFYENPERYAFSVEMSFLADRYKQLSLELKDRDLFQPLTIADYAPFKSLLFAQQNLNEAEFPLYRQFWNLSLGKLPAPNLIIRLLCSQSRLLENIAKRGRSYEQSIPIDYLQRINLAYEDFFKQRRDLPTLSLDVSDSDFIRHPEQLQPLLEKINTKLADA